MNIACHSGDLGDIVSSLIPFRQIGGGTYILAPYPHRLGGPREPMSQQRANFLLPLLRVQSYINDARFEERPVGVTHDFTTLRFTTHKNDARDSLADWHAKHLGITQNLNLTPWLKAEPMKEYAGRIVVARSRRYNNHEFPWQKIFQKYGDRAVFVGTREEHHRMRNLARGRLQWAQCTDALGMARIIASAEHFYANQSFPLWLAMGLGVRFTAECWRPSPDVRLEGANGRYFFGKKDNPEIAKDP